MPTCAAAARAMARQKLTASAQAPEAPAVAPELQKALDLIATWERMAADLADKSTGETAANNRGAQFAYQASLVVLRQALGLPTK